MWYSLISTPITTYTSSRRCNCGGMSTCLILPLTYYSPVSPSVMLTLWLRGHLPERCWTSLILVRPSRRCPPCSHARRRNMTCLTFVRCPAPTHREAGRADVREMPCSRAHRRNRTRWRSRDALLPCAQKKQDALVDPFSSCEFVQIIFTGAERHSVGGQHSFTPLWWPSNGDLGGKSCDPSEML
jgi:hypothetical protein